MKCLLVKLAHISRRNDIIISGVYLVCSIYVRPDLAAANERRPIISGVYLVCSIYVRPDLAAANERRPFISGVYLCVCSI